MKDVRQPIFESHRNQKFDEGKMRTDLYKIRIKKKKKSL